MIVVRKRFFTQQDPIGLAGGLNLYGFASGDPVNFSDPFGLCKEPIGRGVGICVQSFIARPTVFGQRVGDDRGPRSNGGTFKSNQSFSIDPSSGAMSGLTQQIGATNGNAGIGELIVSPVRAARGGGWNVSVTGNVMSVDMPRGMDISYSFDLHMSEAGDVPLVGGEFDGFPSFEIWAYGQDGGARRVAFFAEGNVSALGGAPENKVIKQQ